MTLFVDEKAAGSGDFAAEGWFKNPMRFQKAEIAKWSRVVKAANVNVE